jgi:hypothetical protein
VAGQADEDRRAAGQADEGHRVADQADEGHRVADQADEGHRVADQADGEEVRVAGQADAAALPLVRAGEEAA